MTTLQLTPYEAETLERTIEDVIAHMRLLPAAAWKRDRSEALKRIQKKMATAGSAHAAPC